MNKNERTIQAFGTMFGNMKEQLESQKNNQTIKNEEKIPIRNNARSFNCCFCVFFYSVR